MDDPLWSLSQQAMSLADDVYFRDFEPIKVEPYAQGVLTETGEQPRVADRQHREWYADSLFDLIRLLEEIRFEVGFAAMLMADYRARNPTEDELSPDPDSDIPFSIELLAVLSTYSAPIPPPSQLAMDLHRELPGKRHLSRWLAGQLLDSAMLRSLSVLDRVATMLFIRAGRTIELRRDGTPRFPSFGTDELRSMRSAYEGRTEWATIREVARDEMYQFIKRYRDGNVHHRRWPSALHGESTLSYWDAGAARDEPRPARRLYEGMTAAEHLAFVTTAWNAVLRPVVEAGGGLASLPASP